MGGTATIIGSTNRGAGGGAGGASNHATNDTTVNTNNGAANKGTRGETHDSPEASASEPTGNIDGQEGGKAFGRQ